MDLIARFSLKSSFVCRTNFLLSLLLLLFVCVCATIAGVHGKMFVRSKREI